MCDRERDIVVTIKYNNGEYAFLVFFKERKRGLMWNVECGVKELNSLHFFLAE